MSAFQYLDTCDRCLTADSPAIRPVTLMPSGPGSVLAVYCCPTCRSAWTCSWAVQVDEETAA